jgi:hypothetical protein
MNDFVLCPARAAIQAMGTPGGLMPWEKLLMRAQRIRLSK